MKARIFPYFSRIYKYGNTNIPAQDTTQIPVGQYDFNLGSLEKIINFDDFDALYYANDTNQEHPVYVLKPANKPDKIDLNGEAVSTFFVNDNDYYDLVDGFALKTDKVIGCGFDTDGRNFTLPTQAKTDPNDVEPDDRYNKALDLSSTYTYIENYSGMVPRAKYIYDNIFTNGTIEGIRAIYDSRDDSMMVPAMNLTTRHFEYYGADGNIYMRSEFGSSGSTRNSLNFGGSNNYNIGYSGEFQILQDVQSNPDELAFTTFFPPILNGGTTADTWTFNYGTRTGSRATNIKMFPIFLKSENGEYWVLFISRLSGYVDYGYPQSIAMTRWNMVLMRVKDIPINMPSSGKIPSSSNAQWISTEQFSSPDVIDQYLDVVFNQKFGPNYDDGGPDAIGPGDPYEDENNAGEAVGGDANIVDDITPPDISPNTSYESYVIDNGLYGSYKLTTANLRNYTKTLQLCRDNAWIPGELGDKFENMGNLIQENTVSVFMLPVDIEETGAVPFNVGTKAIRNTDVVGNWGKPTSVDTTNLINKYTKEYVYPLGTISHYYDNFLDFAPYSTASLYIPYIGKVEIPINLVQSTSTDQKQLSLSIRLNRTNGDILCILLSNNIPLCRWQGNCARSIALSVNDNSAILQNQFSRLVSSFSSGLGALGAAATGNVGGATSNLGQMFAAPMASGAPITTSSHMIGNAPETGDVGWMDSQLITLTVERPIWWKPYDYGDLIGYPTRKIAKLATVSGFAKVPNIHIRCSATESEKERLKTMLAEGVLF